MISILLAVLLSQTSASGIEIRDEGSTQGTVWTLDCVGGSIGCVVSGTVVTITISSGGGAAPDNGEYITYAANATLSAERVLSDGTNTTVDLGTVGQAQVDLNSTVTGITNLQMDDNSAICFDGSPCLYTINAINAFETIYLNAGASNDKTVQINAGLLDVRGNVTATGNVVLNGTISDSSGPVQIADATEVAGALSVTQNGNGVSLYGTDHFYFAMFPDGSGAGRKAYFGFGSPSDDHFSLVNESSGNNIRLVTTGTGNVDLRPNNTSVLAVTTTGISATQPLTISTGTNTPLAVTTSSAAPWAFQHQRSDLASTGSFFYDGTSWYFNKPLSVSGSTVWNAGNDGAGSTLDADFLDTRTSDQFVWTALIMPNSTLTDASADLSGLGLTDERHYSGWVTNKTGYPQAYGGVFGVKNSGNAWSYSWQMFTGFDSSTPYYRHVLNDGSQDWSSWYNMWHSGNDGSGSGLDADTLDGISSASFHTGTLAIGSGGTGQTTAAAAFNALSPTTTQGDIIHYHGVSNTRLAAGAAGTVLTMNAGATSPEWAAPSGWRGGGRSFHQCQPVTTVGTTFACNGPTVQSVTAAATNANPQSTRYYIQWGTSSVSGNAAGQNASNVYTRPGYRPIYYARTRTEATISLRRQWHGLVESTIAALPVRSSGAGAAASAIDFVAIGFDTAVSANWHCCAGDGTNYSCSDVGTSVAANTDYTVSLDWKTAGTLICNVNGTSVSKTTNLSTAAVNLAIQNQVTTNSAAIVFMNLAHYELEQN
jgi:hypothetical protein